MSKFDDYFEEGKDYPGVEAVLNPIPLGIRYDFVASSYLNGFINYGTFLKAFAIGRHCPWDEIIGRPTTVQVRENLASTNVENKWVTKQCSTRNELFNTVTQPNAIIHPTLMSHFRNDVLILQKLIHEDHPVQYLFFWFDEDVSDCSIGRFETDDPEEVVIQKFENYVKSLEFIPYGSREIPLQYFKGWVSS